MKVLLTIAHLLAVSLSVYGDAPACPDQKTKDRLQEYKVNKDITPLLKGNTYVDIWRRKASTTAMDCSMTEFKESADGLVANIHNVEKDGKHLTFSFKWTENKGQSSFTSPGEIQIPGQDKVVVNDYIHVFHADENVLGYFSCDLNSGFIRMAISVRKDKEKDAKAAESMTSAETIMNKLKDLLPDEMAQFERKKCPEKV